MRFSEYGSMWRSFFIGANFVTSTLCFFVYLRIPSAPWRRAEAGLLPAAHRQLERHVVDLRVVHGHRPASIRRASRSPLAASFVHTDAWSP